MPANIQNPAFTIDGEEPAYYLTQVDAAELLHISTRTLERMRHEGTGPPFLKAGRRVLYDPGDIHDWLHARSFTSAAEARASGAR